MAEIKKWRNGETEKRGMAEIKKRRNGETENRRIEGLLFHLR